MTPLRKRMVDGLRNHDVAFDGTEIHFLIFARSEDKTMPSFHVVQNAIEILLSRGDAMRAERLARRWTRITRTHDLGGILLARVFGAQGRYADALRVYDEVMRVVKLPTWELAHNRAVTLIDGAIDGAFPDRSAALQEGVHVLSRLAELSRSDPAIHYNLANGLSALGIEEEARAHLHTYLDKAPPRREVLVNLANSYRDARRYCEAMDLCLGALRLDREHDMAWASLASAFNHAYYMTAGKYDHLLLLSEICCRRAESVFDGYSRAPASVAQARRYLQGCTAADFPEVLMEAWESWLDLSTLDERRSDLRSFYETVAARDCLTLDLFRDCPHPPHALPDPPICDGFTHTLEQEHLVPEWFRILNTIHWEYHAARTKYIEAQRQPAEFVEVDRLFRFVDVGDAAAFTYRNRLLLECIASSMNIFDKIGLFLNSYFGLGIPERKVQFTGQKSVLLKLEGVTERGVRENLDALGSMSKDLDNSFFVRAKEYRHSFTHRYVVPFDGQADGTEPREDNWTRIESKTLKSLSVQALRLAKAGIYYTAGVVTCNDFHLEQGKFVDRRPKFPPVSPVDPEYNSSEEEDSIALARSLA